MSQLGPGSLAGDFEDPKTGSSLSLKKDSESHFVCNYALKYIKAYRLQSGDHSAAEASAPGAAAQAVDHSAARAAAPGAAAHPAEWSTA